MNELRKVERAAARSAAAREALEAAIREASSAGASLRAIASAANVSHETVRVIVGAS